MTETEITQFLADTKLCNGFLQRELSKIASVSKIKVFKANELVFADGENKDHLNHFYIVLDGDIQISKSYDYDGNKKSLLLNILTSGDCFGEIAIITQSNTRTASVKCLTATRLIMIDKRDFWEIYQANRKLADNLLLIFINHLHQSNNVSRFVAFSVKDASARLMYMVDFLRSKYGVLDDNCYVITLPFNSSRITDFLSMKQQLFSRCKSNLKKRGLLEVSGKVLVISDYNFFCKVLYGD